MTMKEFKEIVSGIPDRYDDLQVFMRDKRRIDGEHTALVDVPVVGVCIPESENETLVISPEASKFMHGEYDDRKQL